MSQRVVFCSVLPAVPVNILGYQYQLILSQKLQCSSLHMDIATQSQITLS